MSASAYQMYKRTQVSTASQGDLLLMLFDGAVKFARQGRELIERKEYAAANEKLQRTQNIVSELISSLNLDTGQIAQDLYQLYRYIHERLVQANIKKDLAQLDEAIQMLDDFRDTWRQVVYKT